MRKDLNLVGRLKTPAGPFLAWILLVSLTFFMPAAVAAPPLVSLSTNAYANGGSDFVVGESYSLTVSVSGDWAFDATGVEVSFVVPSWVDPGSVSMVSGAGVWDPATGVWTVGDVPIDAIVEMVVQWSAGSVPGSGSMNACVEAYVLSADQDLDPANDYGLGHGWSQGCETVTAGPSPSVYADSSPSVVEVPVGVPFGVQFSFFNGGTVDATGVTASVPIPDWVEPGSVVATPTVGTYDPATGVWDIGVIQADFLGTQAYLDMSWTAAFVPAGGQGCYDATLTHMDQNDDDTLDDTTSGCITVLQDTTPPDLTVPADMVVEAYGPTGSPVAFAASAWDETSGALPTLCAPASGSVFAIGETSVECSATDAAGNTAAASFTVTVVDTTAPTLMLPGTVTVTTPEPSGVAVAYTATATDLVDVTSQVVCNPPSGTLFPVGSTLVSCVATDSAGNSGFGSFDVTVVLMAPANRSPIAPNLRVITQEDSAVNFTLPAYDPDGDPLAYTVAYVYGTITGTAPNLRYRPPQNYFGQHTATYTACDNHGACDTGNLTLKVNAVADAPRIAGGESLGEFNPRRGWGYSYCVFFWDPDGRLPSTFRGTIDWGDGTSSKLQFYAGGSTDWDANYTACAGLHYFPRTGRYTIRVTITDPVTGTVTFQKREHFTK